MNFKRTKDFLVCVDSDGCAMDTMNIKHFRAFGPEFVKSFQLEDIEKDVLDHWNKTNLYSETRGINRFLGFLESMEYVNGKYRKIEGLETFKTYVEEGGKLSYGAVEEAYKKTKEAIFKIAMDWSNNVNTAIENISAEENKPFENVISTLKTMRKEADVIVVSSATKDAIETEWKKAGLIDYVDAVFTQEFGSKTESISFVQKQGDYKNEHVLKVGDSPGDLKAAQDNHVFFYPIIANQEEKSWIELRDVYFEKFIAEDFTGVQEELIDKFFSELKEN